MLNSLKYEIEFPIHLQHVEITYVYVEFWF